MSLNKALWNAALSMHKAYMDEKAGRDPVYGPWRQAETHLRWSCADRPSSQGLVKGVTELRRLVPHFAIVPRSAQTQCLRTLDKAMAAWWKRRKDGTGFPRFKRQIDSLALQDGRLKGGQFHMPGIAPIHVVLHRTLEGTPKMWIVRDCGANGWELTIQCDNVAEKREPMTGREVGIDLGIKSMLTTDQGQHLAPLQPLRASLDKLARVQRKAARAIKTMVRVEGISYEQASRKVKQSKRWRKKMDQVARVHTHVANVRADVHHKVSRDLVRQYDRIAVEKLNVSGLARGFLGRQCLDVGFGGFLTTLKAKALEAGKIVVAVSPAGTSQDCSRCGVKVQKKLSERTHHCPDCGLVLDRDINAARNILIRAQAIAWAEVPTDCGLMDVEGKDSRRVNPAPVKRQRQRSADTKQQDSVKTLRIQGSLPSTGLATASKKRSMKTPAASGRALDRFSGEAAGGSENT